VKSYGILVLRSSNVKNSKIDFEDCVFVNCSVDENKYVQPNDILICVRNGSSALIGKSCVIDKPYNATFGAFMSILRGDKTGYVAHVFASDIVQSQIRNRSSATINQITKRDFEDIVIPIPAEETEQRRIAEALSNTDALLAAMEKLIAKKRAIKQGAMQELLTGKRRLPRFEGEWVETTLGKVVLDIKTGKRNNEEKVENGRYAFFVRSQQVERINDYSYDCEAILVPGEGNIGQIFHYVNGKFDCHQRVYKISEFVGVDAKFIYYYMKMFFGQYALANTVKATVDSLRLPTFVCFGMSIPSSKKEQTAIAEILSDMDAEIDALAAKLNKLRNIKQGMMSELLTGRIRLADSAPAKATVEAYPEQEAEPIHQVAEPATKGHDQQFDDAVMIAGIVNVLYSDKYPIGRKKVQKCLYLLRRHQDESTEAFKKKAADPYADEVRYKGGEPIARKANYIATTTGKQGTTFVRGKNIGKALGYIQSWGRGADIKWVADKLKFKSVDELELLATVDMAICDLAEAGTTVSIESIKHLIAANAEWKAKLKKQIFSDANIARAILELNTLLQGCY
jgi:type I restriction enzyme S subunit